VEHQTGGKMETVIELFLIGVGLSMDAFAVAICKGLKMRKVNYKHTLIIALFFGGFQALMPFVGWMLGRGFAQYVERFAAWIAFFLLLYIGGKMVYEAITDHEEVDSEKAEKLDLKELLMLAVATSIDALAVGITFAFLGTNIVEAISIIGCTTFVLSLLGVMIGNRFGVKYKDKASIAGGVILILIGLKILLEHFGIL
jgi:putative Mn2+ efflux pump MntP